MARRAKKRGIKNGSLFVFAIAIVAIFALVMFFYQAPKPTGFATDTVNMSASITATVSCSASPATLSFGSLTLGSDTTSGSATIVDTTGSNTVTNINSSVTSASSWIPGFTTTNNAWGIKCPHTGNTAASGLTSSSGYSQHEFSPTENICRRGAGISGVTVGLGTGTIVNLAQNPESHSITSRIKAPTGTTPGSYWSIVTFTCSQITGGAAGMSFELADVELTGPPTDATVLCDGATQNRFVAQLGLGPAQGNIVDSTSSIIHVCDSVHNCIPATVTSQITTPGASCGNVVAPVASTTNGVDIVCGEFTCPGGTLTPGAGQVFIQTGALNNPAGEVAHSYLNVTLL